MDERDNLMSLWPGHVHQLPASELSGHCHSVGTLTTQRPLSSSGWLWYCRTDCFSWVLIRLGSLLSTLCLACRVLSPARFCMVLLVFLMTGWMSGHGLGPAGDEEDMVDGYQCSKTLRHLRVALVRISLVVIVHANG